MSNLIDRDRARAALSIRREDDDPVLVSARAAAAEHGIWVHLGSLALRGPDGKFVNRAFVIDPNGAIVYEIKYAENEIRKLVEN